MFRAVTKFTKASRPVCVAFILLIAFARLCDAQSVDNSLITLSDCWKMPLNAQIVSPPVADTNQLYIAQEGGRISAVALASGTRLWSAEIGGEIVSNVVPDGKNIYLVSNIGGRRSVLRSISSVSGIPNMETDIPYGENIRLGVSNGKTIVVYQNGTLAAYEFGSGKPLWQLMLSPINIAAVTFTDQAIVIPTEDKKLQVISAPDGKVVLSVPTRGTVTAVGMIEEDLLWGEDRGSLVRFDTEGKLVSWRYKNGAKIAALRSTERGILAASFDNFVYLLSGYNGDIRWKKRLSGRVAGMTVSGDVGIILTVGDQAAVLINLETGKQVGQFVAAENDGFIFPSVATGDQMLFFTGAQIVAKSAKTCGAN